MPASDAEALGLLVNAAWAGCAMTRGMGEDAFESFTQTASAAGQQALGAEAGTNAMLRAAMVYELAVYDRDQSLRCGLIHSGPLGDELDPRFAVLAARFPLELRTRGEASKLRYDKGRFFRLAEVQPGGAL